MTRDDLAEEGRRWIDAEGRRHIREFVANAATAVLFAWMAWRMTDVWLRAGGVVGALGGAVAAVAAWRYRLPEPPTDDPIAAYRHLLRVQLARAPMAGRLAVWPLVPGPVMMAIGVVLASTRMGPGIAIPTGLAAIAGAALVITFRTLLRARADRVAELAARLDTLDDVLSATPTDPEGDEER